MTVASASGRYLIEYQTPYIPKKPENPRAMSSHRIFGSPLLHSRLDIVMLVLVYESPRSMEDASDVALLKKYLIFKVRITRQT